MRDKLRIYENSEITVKAVYKKYATTNRNKNLLFKFIIKDNEQITDHVWIRLQDIINNFNYHETKIDVEITGKISTYMKYDKNGNKVMDYCFKNVKIKKIQK